ncbi:DUF262 domain-containing protein [Intestinibacter bartlettii]|uniref:DUF262 domain-containing protein n=1 Tax=Intestinibacter bartlettii CAG:1329 TaxID=1263063 RepID=R5XA52_9FIRM|nr:DUF262 domain-containing protein [Intestinibacter bartlettii]CDA09269.1 putative uncharacterized protein [Intestinibacter bartlettii CAG:1329]
MVMTSVTRGIEHILSGNRKYIIPRFQREYSWGKNEIATLWEDIFTNMDICNENDEIKLKEYFIGSLVLIGNDTNGNEFEIVDGQQRLTTIMILLSAIGEYFYTNQEIGKFDSIYNYIEGSDKEGNLFFKLINENIGDFLPARILAKPNEKNIDEIPEGKEQKNLLDAYNFFINKLNSNEVVNDFKKYVDEDTTLSKTQMVGLIRDQILEFTTVFITVDNLDDAYKIFETLNAKGKNLEAIDLIKNSIFSVLSKDHPIDNAKRQWSKIQENLQGESRELFYRQFWISKYSFSTNKNLYKAFNDKIECTKERYEGFLKELEQESKWYQSIINPINEDYPNQDLKFEYEALKAFKIFNVYQVRVILLALKRAKEERRISFNDYKRAIESLEKFHFIYIAVCSERGSGIERILSTNALRISNTENKNDMNITINKLIEDLKSKIPDYDIFRLNFEKIIFTNKITKQKQLIQYIFKKMEKVSRTTDELTVNNISLEHIMPQSENKDCVGKIGNILPLDKKINSDMGNIEFSEKIKCLEGKTENEGSELNVVKEFVKKYKDIDKWDEECINNRTQDLANKSYNEIWTL